MKYQDTVLIEFLKSARQPVSAKDVLAHLHGTIEGFTENQGKDNGLKNTQNRLKKLAEDPNYSQTIKVTQQGKKKLYQGIATPLALQSMSIEQACTLLMADKHLSAIAPTRLLQNEDHYQDLISQATAAVEKERMLRKMKQKDIAGFMKRVTVMQRGQRLQTASLDDKVLSCIAESIVRGRCINIRYKGKDRELHPYGLVFRQPKVYLLALDTKTLLSNGPSKARPRQYLCNRIEKASLRKEAHQVPESFDIEDYVSKGRLDLMAYPDTVRGQRRFTLRLRIIDHDNDNLIRDLAEYPLCDAQTLTKETATGHCILTAPGMLPTHTLMDWIIGRLDRVEVLGPSRLREHVAGQIRSLHQIYFPE